MISKQLCEEAFSRSGDVYISRLNRVVGKRGREEEEEGKETRKGLEQTRMPVWTFYGRISSESRRISSFRSSSPRLGERLLERDDDDDAFEAPF